MHALTIMSGEQQTCNYYMNIGPLFSYPLARQLYAEIAHIEEQHVAQYQAIIDPEETWLEKRLLHKGNEVYNYYGCAEGNQFARQVRLGALPGIRTGPAPRGPRSFRTNMRTGMRKAWCPPNCPTDRL
jgi:hypothetical protein